MLFNATHRLIQVASDRSSSPSEFQIASADFFSHVGTSTAEEVRAAMVELAASFGIEDPRRAAILGLICGALAEDGQNTGLFAKPLLDRFASVLDQATGLVLEIEPKLPPAEDEEEESDDESYEFEAGGFVEEEGFTEDEELEDEYEDDQEATEEEIDARDE